MSVLKSKRKESQFEVFHHLYKLRKEVTNLLIMDFGYSHEKFEKGIEKQFGGASYAELTDDQKEQYDRRKKRQAAFDEWFITDERKKITDYLSNITSYTFVANSIYPMYAEELKARRMYQDRAIGECYALAQELQYCMETLPVNADKYLRFGELIEKEIALLKGWRKSDNKFKRAISDTAANFANVNNNGNANNNNASNSNGVRPDFDIPIK